MTAARHTLRLLLLPALAVASAHAQMSPVVTGLVTDPSNALIPNATLVFHEAGPFGGDQTVVTTRNGSYIFHPHNLGAHFEISATAPGFAPFDSGPMQFKSDEHITLNIRLKVAAESQQVDVSDSTMDTDPSRNGDAITLTGSAIDALPLDSTELLQQLQGMSGGASPDLFVDGFSGGTLPPRDTIREIRINQNPYSAQNDTNPSNGQIQIFTKPGSNKFHGDGGAYSYDNAFNTADPFVSAQPPYYSIFTFGDLSGPISKHMSFFVNGGSTTSQTNSVIDAQILDANLNQTSFNEAVATPNNAYNFSTRIDTAIGKKSTVIFRYSLAQSNQTNGGIGQLALPSQGYNNANANQVFQLSNSQILTEKMVNDTRFQYTRSRVNQTPDSTAPAVSVAGAFTGGGNSGGAYNDNQDRYELQNYVSASAGKQFFTFGGRFRATRDANRSSANYNGTFTFATLAAYQITQQGLAAGQTAAQILAAGGGASQFSLAAGNPNVAVMVADGALFFQDDWKAKSNLTVSGGLRFETQNVIADKADWAPRFGLAWGIGAKKNKPARYMFRAGAGLFYSRFTSGYDLQAARQNGVTQQEYLVADPTFFPAVPSVSALGASQSPSAIYQIGPRFHAPYSLSTTASIERQIKTWGSVTLTGLVNRGVHQQLTDNVNAPLPGTYNPAVPTSGTRPLGGNQNVYQYQSEGVSRTNHLTANFFLHFKDRYYVYGFYSIRNDTADTSGGFPSNQYDLGADQGRASNDARHQANVGASMPLPFNFIAWGYVRVQSGNPFNITVGQDLNGDSIFNDRPAFATDLTRPSVVKTSLGNFDTSPIAGQTIIPINYGHGPGFFMANLGLNRQFNFGPEVKPPAGSPAPKLKPGQKPQIHRRYTLTVGAVAQNLFNQVNLGQPVGTLNSPFFGKSLALAAGNGSATANRVVGLQTYFNF